jgi:hypothetical protein
MKHVLAVATLVSSGLLAMPEPALGAGAQTKIAALGHRVRWGTVSAKPLDLVEDSRCPRYVSCVWRGRLVIKAALGDGKVVSLENGKPLAIQGGTLTLVDAVPVSGRGEKIPPSHYRFRLSFRR